MSSTTDPPNTNTSENMPEVTASTQPIRNRKPIVVGLYGLPGSGKSYLLQHLKRAMGEVHFAFYEGSKVIASLVDGGLEAFHNLDVTGKEDVRCNAINLVARDCSTNDKVGVVVGHLMFWNEGEEMGRFVYTQDDLDTFTHILYLRVPPGIISQRRLDDNQRSRPRFSITHLDDWQNTEEYQLRNLCREQGILFSCLDHTTCLDKTPFLLNDFRHHTEENNLSRVFDKLDMVLQTDQRNLETVLLLDGDRTLAAQDTGALFWARIGDGITNEDPLRSLFSSPLGYSYTAFRQATLLYEETCNDEEFDSMCQDLASTVTMHPEFVSLLHEAAQHGHVGALVLTCGLSAVWQKVLERERLSQTVKVIGGSRISDGFVVTAEVKAALVTRLQENHQLYIWAFGDSPLDLPMLSRADQAIVVVGEEQARSKTMDAALTIAIDNEGFRARQTTLPSSSTPRLNTTKLPLVQITEQGFLDSVFCRRGRPAPLQVLHATKKSAAKLLMTSMRDSRLTGPALRVAHHRAGFYLAIEFLSDAIGTEEHPILHVQGHQVAGHRFLHEQETLIVALMRGGEPMAFGVNNAFPMAMFLHANQPEDIKSHHVKGKVNLILVDSVVNSGKTLLDFVKHIRKIHASLRIVVVAGVVQSQAIARESMIAQALSRNAVRTIIALRVSDNKYTGTGTTDTGNRLFNTTHLP